MITIILSCIGGFLVGYISALVLLLADTEDDEEKEYSGLLTDD